jgi:hypothetical protein
VAPEEPPEVAVEVWPVLFALGGHAASAIRQGGATAHFIVSLRSSDLPLQTCEAGCSATDAGACLDCGFECAQQYVCCATSNCSGYL